MDEDVYTEMGWCDDMRDKLGSHMLLYAECSYREIEPRFIRLWLQGPSHQSSLPPTRPKDIHLENLENQGPVLQDAAAANRRRCVRNVLTDVAQQEDQDGNHARKPSIA